MRNAFLFLVSIALFASCSTNRAYKSVAPSYGYDSYSERGSRSAKSETLAGFSEEQMIIYNAGIGLVVKNPDTAATRVTSIAKKYEGYVVSISQNSVSIRVKSEHLNSAMKEIELLGKLKYKDISGDDVTMEYNNLTIRLDNANKARQRYLELLAKAEDVKAALEVEKELERLNKEIDLLEMQIRNITQQVNYSLITVSLEERTQPGILGYVFIGLYKGVKWLFVWN
ncbi:hypothetical protein DSECCO2_441950 [anaerobic digester metagenome]